MENKRAPLAPAGITALACALLLSACSDQRAQSSAVRQTGFPGQVSAGGTSSGEVMSRAPNTVAQMPAGTPGIPQGSGGTTGGAALGATVQSQATPDQQGGPPPAPSRAAPMREGRGVTAPNPTIATSKPAIGVGGTPEKGEIKLPEGPK